MTHGPRLRRARAWRGPLAAIALLSVGALLIPAGVFADAFRPRPAADLRVPIAVLGDSDSHGYGDRLWFPPGGGLRGGASHPGVAMQWTEALAALRSEHVDLGDVGTWGGRSSVVRAVEALGLERRAPRKHDHQFNFAFAGARCRDLASGPWRQLPRLLALMDREPERWRRGVVVIRIGIVDLGGEEQLARMARDPDDPALVEQVRACVADIATAVQRLHARHPETRIVLVGLFDNSEAPPFLAKWRSERERGNILSALDRFDGALRELADADRRIGFFDDRGWFRARWGGRSTDGTPQHRVLTVAGRIEVRHAAGDEPGCTALADGHAGLVVNTLWAQSLVELLAGAFALPIPPISAGEVERLLRERYAPWR